MEQKIIELAKKLHQLSIRGEDGEKDSATEMLARMLGKHGISIDSIVEDKKKERRFDYESKFHDRFINQVIASVVSDFKTYKYTYRKEKAFYVEMTDSEFIEAQCKIDFYWNIWKKELEAFYGAFVQKQCLYRKGSSSKQVADLTEDELEQLRKTLAYMDSIEKKTLVKMLENA